MPTPPAAPTLRSLAWSAFRSGGLRSLTWRPSGRSFTWRVAVCSFASPAAALRFARRWAARLGVSIAVRGCAVSVPVVVPPGCRLWSWEASSRPGVRGLARSLRILSINWLSAYYT